MKVILESKNSIRVTILPELISGNYWILDDNSKNLLNVIEEDNQWVLKSNAVIKMSSGLANDNLNGIRIKESEILEPNKVYYLTSLISKENYTLYTLPSFEKFENLCVNWQNSDSITIGSDQKCDIIVSNSFFSSEQLSMNVVNGNIYLKNMDNRNKSFVNNELCNETI